MTKSELIDWKRSLVTQEILYEFKRRQDALKEELVYATDLRVIAMKQGAILAYSDFLDIEPEGGSNGD